MCFILTKQGKKIQRDFVQKPMDSGQTGVVFVLSNYLKCFPSGIAAQIVGPVSLGLCLPFCLPMSCFVSFPVLVTWDSLYEQRSVPVAERSAEVELNG